MTSNPTTKKDKSKKKTPFLLESDTKKQTEPKIKLEPLDPTSDDMQTLFDSTNREKSASFVNEDDMTISIIDEDTEVSASNSKVDNPDPNVEARFDSASKKLDVNPLTNKGSIEHVQNEFGDNLQNPILPENNPNTKYIYLPCLVKISGVFGSADHPKSKLEQMGMKNEIILKLHDVRESSIEDCEELMFLCTYLSYPRGPENLFLECSEDLKKKTPEARTKIREKWAFTFWATSDWWRSLLENSFCAEGMGTCSSKMFLSQRMPLDENESNWIDWDENEIVFFPQENTPFEKFVSMIPPDEELTVPTWATDLAGTNFSLSKQDSRLRRELATNLPCANYYNSLDGLFRYCLDKITQQEVEKMMEKRIIKIGEFSGPKALAVMRAIFNEVKRDPGTLAYIVGDRKSPQGRTRVFPPKTVSFRTNKDDESEQGGALSSQDLDEHTNSSPENFDSNSLVQPVNNVPEAQDPVAKKAREWIKNNKHKLADSDPVPKTPETPNISTPSAQRKITHKDPEKQKTKKQKLQKAVEANNNIEQHKSDEEKNSYPGSPSSSSTSLVAPSVDNQKREEEKTKVKKATQSSSTKAQTKVQEQKFIPPKTKTLENSKFKEPKTFDGKNNTNQDEPLSPTIFTQQDAKKELLSFDSSKSTTSNEFGSFDPNAMMSQFLC